MSIRVLSGDITEFRADAIVNAANSSLLGGGGVDGAIHRAGGPAILAECRELRRTSFPDGLPIGQAVATGAGSLPATWVVHTVGPVYGRDDAGLLDSCYTESLRVAADLGAESVAFPLVSAGVYGWPKDDAVRRALRGFAGAPAPVATIALVLFDPEDVALAGDIAASEGIELES